MASKHHQYEKIHINMKAKLSGKLGFDFIPKEKTRREYEPLTSYNLGLFWGIQAYQVKIQVLTDQEFKAPELRNQTLSSRQSSFLF